MLVSAQVKVCTSVCGKILLMHAESCNVIIIKWDSAEHWSIISEHEVQSLLSSPTELCSHMYLNIWIPHGRYLLFYTILEELWQRESNTLHDFACDHHDYRGGPPTSVTSWHVPSLLQHQHHFTTADLNEPDSKDCQSYRSILWCNKACNNVFYNQMIAF